MNVEALNQGICAGLMKAAISTVAPIPPKRKSYLPYVLGGAGVLGLGLAGAYGLHKFDQNNKNWTDAYANAKVTPYKNVASNIPATYRGANISATSTPTAEALNTGNSALASAGGLSFLWNSGKNLVQKAMSKPTTGPGWLGRTLTGGPLLGAAGVSGYYSMANDPLVKGNVNHSFLPGASTTLANPLVGALGTAVGNQALRGYRESLVSQQGESAIMQGANNFLLDNLEKIRHNDPQKQDAARQIISWVMQNKQNLSKYKERFPASFNLIQRANNAAQQTL